MISRPSLKTNSIVDYPVAWTFCFLTGTHLNVCINVYNCVFKRYSFEVKLARLIARISFRLQNLEFKFPGMAGVC